MTSYTKKALWDKVDAWFKGGPPAEGLIDPSGAAVHTFPGRGGATWKIYTRDVEKDKRPFVNWKSFANPIAINQFTYGFRWNVEFVTKIDTPDGPLYRLPQYYRFADEPALFNADLTDQERHKMHLGVESAN